ncbi:MAG: protein kinase [Gammaproteobacteria bacterium]|nr:protein kinase [Gammaproteobacteria bacterium]
MLELPGYKIEKEIGKGGMARVYLALHEGLQRQVAIKVMSRHLDEDMDFSERFMREARIVANLNHQHIVTVYDVNVYDGYHYIAMEYLPGGVTLDTKIKQGITPQEGLETIKQVAAALAYAHSKDIVHRDIKPENIMYREDGSAILTDFGIARSTTATTKMTVTGTVIGTPHYMSPEQAQGKELTLSSDIYSLGVVLYELLTGKVPYEADSTVSVLLKHVSEPVPSLEGELAIYQPVLDCMMAKDKESRYQNCGEIIADIDSLIAGGDASNATTVINQALQATVVQQADIPADGTPAIKRKQKRLIVAIAAGVFVAASAGGYLVYQQNQAAKEQQRQAEFREQEEQRMLEEKQLQAKKQAEEKATELKARQEEMKRLAAQKKAEEEKAKQLATLELKKKEEARRVKQKVAQEKARLAKQKQINDMLSRAELQLQNTQLKAANQSFQDVLKLEPGNSTAMKGITRVADRYLALARTFAIANDFDKANSYINSVIKIAPTHERLTSTQKEIIDLKKAQLAAEEEAIRAQQKTSPPATESSQKKRRTYVGF